MCVCGWVYTYIQGEREVALHAFVSNTKSLIDIVDNVTPIVEHQRERILLSVSVCCCALVCVYVKHTYSYRYAIKNELLCYEIGCAASV